MKLSSKLPPNLLRNLWRARTLTILLTALGLLLSTTIVGAAPPPPTPTPIPACVPQGQSCDENNVCCGFPGVACQGGYCQVQTVICGGVTEPCCDLPNPPCGSVLVCQGGYCQPTSTTPTPPGGTTPTPDPGGPGTPDEPCKVNGKDGIKTGLGCIPTDPTGLVNKILQIAIGVSSGIALLLLISGGFRLLTSSGDPKAVMGAKDTITSAIGGLLLILLSVAILNIIGINVLGIELWGP